MNPVYGFLFDIANAGLYYSQGDHFYAGVSAAAAVPGVGLAVTGAKYALKSAKALKVARGATEAADTVVLTAVE